MTLVYFESSMKHQDMYILAEQLKTVYKDEILFIPKEFSVLLNASKEQLLAAKKSIEAALVLKESE